MKWPEWCRYRRRELLLGIAGLSAFGVISLLPGRHWGLLCGFCFLCGVVMGHTCALYRRTGCGLTAQEVARLFQWQRHDFLNHLQVLSALAQLNKPERALEYIASACRDLDRERRLTGLLPPEAGLVLLNWFYRFVEAGVQFEVQLASDLSRGVNGQGLAALLTEIMTLFFRAKPRPQEVSLRSFRADGAEVLEISVRSDTALPLPSLGRAQDLACTLPARLKVKRRDSAISLQILMSPAVPLVAPGARAVGS